MSSILTFCNRLGAAVLRMLDSLGAVTLFMLDGLRHIFTSPRIVPRTIQQLYVIGYKSLFVILLIGIFCGMVLGLQGYYTLVQFGSVGMLGSAVSLSLIRELGPVLTAIMLAGRAGSSMAAEIGVMRISDQIDALDVMDINSMAYLVSPRLVASLLAFPLLTAIFDAIGIIGGADGALGRGMGWQGMSFLTTLHYGPNMWVTSSYMPTFPGKLFFLSELAGPLVPDVN